MTQLASEVALELLFAALGGTCYVLSFVVGGCQILSLAPFKANGDRFPGTTKGQETCLDAEVAVAAIAAATCGLQVTTAGFAEEEPAPEPAPVRRASVKATSGDEQLLQAPASPRREVSSIAAGPGLVAAPGHQRWLWAALLGVALLPLMPPAAWCAMSLGLLGPSRVDDGATSVQHQSALDDAVVPLLPLVQPVAVVAAPAPATLESGATGLAVGQSQGRTEGPHSDTSASNLPLFSVTLTRHSFPVSTVGDLIYYRSAYFGTIHVGMPSNAYKVVFDTGSGHLILPSTYCQSETCRSHRRYRRSESRTAKDIDYDGTPVLPGQPRDQITVSFGTGEVTGVFIEDVVCMHDEEALTNTTDSNKLQSAAAALATSPPGVHADDLEQGCVKLRMIAATQMSEEPFKSFQFDGVLGLGLDGLSQAPEFNFLDVVAASVESWGGSAPHTFAVFLAEDAAEESTITFGGWQEGSLAEEELSWNPVVEPEQGHWTIRIKRLRIDDQVLELCDSGCKGVVDTGTSLLAVPALAFSELYTMLRHPANLEGHCRGRGPQLHIELEHFTITLGPEDYARLERSPVRKSKPRWGEAHRKPASSTRSDLHCKPMLMSMDLPAPLGPKLFILGEPVLRKYYSVYDAKAKQVGFGRARHSYPSHTGRRWRDDVTPAPRKATADSFTNPAVNAASPSGNGAGAGAGTGVAASYGLQFRSMFEALKWRKLQR